MMEIDFADKIPEPPADLVEWLKSKGCFAKNWLIYQCGWSTEILSGTKEKCLDVVCTACGKHFKADREEDIDFNAGCGCGYPSDCHSKYHGRAGESIIEDCKDTKCPLCGAKVNCMHVARVGHEDMGTQWPMVLSRVGENLIAAGYRVRRTVDKQGISTYSVEKYEAYIFTLKKALRFCAWHSSLFGEKCLIGVWESRKRCRDVFGGASFIYFTGKDVFCGTAFANCKFNLYIKSNTKEIYPISYLIFYRKHPQIENLLVQGFKTLVIEATSNYLNAYADQVDINAVNWKEVSPRKMLGLSKPDFEFLKRKQVNSKDIVNFRKLRQANLSMEQEEIMAIMKEFSYYVDEIVRYGKSIGKLMRYFKKQTNKESMVKRNLSIKNTFITWKDYINMAENLGYNTDEEIIKFPPNLFDAHDRAVTAHNFIKQEVLIKRFKDMYEKLIPYCFEKDGLIIRPAASEEELINEGKILCHCVGGYGKSHCDGKPILFIRKVSDPDMPYYTLQLDLCQKVIIQNHGHGNIAPPKEVKQFTDYWIDNIVRAVPKAVKTKKKKAIAA
jgi:hypothetical protein